MEIRTTNHQELLSPRQIQNLCQRISRAPDLPQGEVSILLVGDREMAGYNRRYRGRQGPTNVLAFPMKEGLYGEINPDLWGDVVVSTETAWREACEAGTGLTERVEFLILHGMLHLMGYDHEPSRAEARKMEKKTREIASLLAAMNKEEAGMGQARLAVNVDHVATVRQARKIDEPDPVLAAGLAEMAGAEGIIVHLREDRRHIQDRDLSILRETVRTKLNLEMAASEEIIRRALRIKPDLVTLVPEKRQELTTEGGLEIVKQKPTLRNVIRRLQRAGIAVSLFIDAAPDQIKASKEVGADIIELHTGHYADARREKESRTLFDRLVVGARMAADLGLRVSAGHGLNYSNIKAFKGIQEIEEYSIGHSIIARAVYVGLDRAVRDMVELVKDL